ncbi:MAG: GAF domain-containing protein [Gemmatimonadaceae bacterium]
MSASADPLGAIAAAFRDTLESAGMEQALAMLNSRTRYRFTGLYRVDPPKLRNLFLFDRENPALSLGGETVPLQSTYCGIVAVTRAPFFAEDAPADSRLVEHSARDSVVSYVGVPVRNADGRVFGTLCHYDVRPRMLPEYELAVLENTSRCISSWLDSHPSDTAPRA